MSAAAGQAGAGIWQPQKGPQALAIAAQFVDELMYGGARGGGKSDFLLGDFLQDVWQGEKWRGILFRKSYPELEELIVRAQEMFLPLGAKYKVSEKVFYFPGGATLKMRHLEKEIDANNYQGHQYTWIGWDELTNWANLKAYKKLKACLRSAHGVKNKRIRCSANPGGAGHHEVKAYFVDWAPKGMELQERTDEDGHVTSRMFIPSKIGDNRILMDNDPTYIARLREVGSPEMVRAWLEGDWNVITGAYFPEFSSEKHVIEPFAIPKHWLRFRSCDWGTASPFAVLWHAVSDGYQIPNGPYIPSGALVTYREWYGCGVTPNTGIRLTGTQVGRGIAEREVGEVVTYGVIDPSAYKQDNGPSIAERMAIAGALFRKADNQRIPGWDITRDRLVGNEDTGPMWYVFKTCTHIIRTLPALQHDIDNPEDVDSDGEDHAPDALRYGFMSRPWKRRRPEIKKVVPIKTLQTITLGEIWEDHEQQVAGYKQL